MLGGWAGAWTDGERLAACVVLFATACGRSVDLEPKPGPEVAVLPAAALARAWTAPDTLCAKGTLPLDFEGTDPAFAFPLVLAAASKVEAAISGNPDLDTALALYGPVRADGSVPAAPVASDDDGGTGDQPSLKAGPVGAPGTYLLVASTWRGRGRGQALLRVVVDGLPGCGGCVGGVPSDPLVGCLPDACGPASCVDMGWDDAWLKAAVGTCTLPADDIWCSLRLDAFGSGWAQAAADAVGRASVVAGGFADAQVSAAGCLARQEPGGGFDVAGWPGAGIPSGLAMSLGMASGIDAAGTWPIERLRPLLGTLFRVEPGDVIEEAEATGTSGGQEVRWRLRSRRGIEVVPGPEAVLAARLDPLQDASGNQCQTGRMLTRVVPGAALAARPVPSDWDATAPEAVREVALAACGAGCRLDTDAPSPVLFRGTPAWRVRLGCPSACSGRDATCTWHVDAATGRAIDGGRDCCEDCGVALVACPEPPLVSSAAEALALLEKESPVWPARKPDMPGPWPVAPEFRVATPLDLTAEAVPVGQCSGCVIGSPRFRVDASVPGATALDVQEGEQGLLPTRVRLASGRYRLRGTIDASTSGTLVPVVAVLPGCGEPCPDGWWRCPVDGACHDPSAETEERAGTTYCLECLGQPIEACACWTPSGTRTDGSPCPGPDPAKVGAVSSCLGGKCVIQAEPTPACDSLPGLLDAKLLDPSVRGRCTTDADCVVAGGASACAAERVLGSPGGEGVRKDALASVQPLWDAFASDRCRTWRDQWALESRGMMRAGAARCDAGRCVADQVPCGTPVGGEP